MNLYESDNLLILGMQPTNIPVEMSFKLQPATSQAERVNQTVYKSGIGSHMYLAVSTRPDIAFAISKTTLQLKTTKRNIGQT